MLGFLSNNWPYVLIIAVFLGYVIYLIATKNWPGLRMLAYAIMLRAEKAYKVEDGAGKLDLVLQALYKRYPLLGLLIKADELKQKLQKWYDKAKDYLDDGAINNSIETPG